MPRVSKWTLGAAVTVVAALAMLTMSFATAAPSGTVSVTVSPIVVEITVPDGTIDFGDVEINGPAVLASGLEPSQAQTVNNLTTTTVQILVRYDASSDPEASCDTGDWTATGSVGTVNQFELEAKLDGGSFTAFDFAADGSTTVLLGTIAGSSPGTVDYEFTPPTSSDVTGPCTIPTLVIATLP